MCVYTVVDKVFARQEISRVFRMFVFVWKHKILIKRLLGQCLSCNGKIKIIGTELSLNQLVVAI